MKTHIKVRQILFTMKRIHTHIHHSKRLNAGILSTDVTLVKNKFIFYSLLCKQVTARVDQVAGKKQHAIVCALCYLRLALQTKVLISQRSVAQAVKKFPAFWGTHYRVVAPHHTSVTCAIWIRYTPSLLFCSKSNVICTFPFMTRSFKCSLRLTL